MGQSTSLNCIVRQAEDWDGETDTETGEQETEKYNWVSWSVGSPLPPNAFQGGTDVDGALIYVGKARYEGDSIPAKIIPSKHAIYVPWGGNEVNVHHCEVLCQRGLRWVDASNGSVPPGAIPIGRTVKGEPLFAARAHHESSQSVGKLHPSHGMAYIPFGGREHPHRFYQVLVADQHNSWAGHSSFQQEAHYWTSWSAYSSFPSNAVRGGTDVDGAPIYVGRSHYQGDLLPAKVLPTKNAAYVPWGGDEVLVQNCEVLCEKSLQWVEASNGFVPPGAISTGTTSCGEPLYVARAYHMGSHCIGKLHPSHRTCYVPFDGQEHSHPSYQVLVGDVMHAPSMPYPSAPSPCGPWGSGYPPHHDHHHPPLYHPHF